MLTTPYHKAFDKLILFFTVSFFFIAIRLFYLQIYSNQEFYSRAQKNFTRTAIINPPRGNILDCNSTLLVTNRPVAHLYWQGTGIKIFGQEHYTLLHALEEITQKNFLDESLLQSIKCAERTGRKLLLLNDVSLQDLSKIMEKFPGNEHIIIEQDLKRFYPYKNLACHILGYIGSLQSTGKMGLELLLENTLKGTQGQLCRMINSFGTSLQQEEIQHALSGQNIKTTLDLSLQTMAEHCFDTNLTGALILLDPQNGAIKALLSRPTFDPNRFLEPISKNDWLDLQEKGPFLNRALNAAYPPASIFKLVSICAALEMGIINQETISECKGFIKFGGRRYHCALRAGHGQLTISEWIAKSCNIPFYEIGKHISIDDLAQYAHRFGFGQKTNIIFNELPGLVPTKEWKLKTKGERWWPGETLSATIGQSYFLATPIQIARMIASIFSGYLITPRILEHEPICQQPLNMRPKTLKILKHSLKTVVTQGTGSAINKIEDIKIYAKTGTAQISSLAKRWQNEQLKEHAWFVAHFRFKKNTPLVLVILIERAGTHRIATSIAKRFLVKYRSHCQNLEKTAYSCTF